jgi:GNAT superfamily N-acetyltransferase
MMIVRPADYRDMFAVEALLRAASLDTKLYPLPVVPACYHHYLRQVSHGLVSVLVERREEDDKVVGLVMLHVEEWAHAPGQGYLTNTHFYIDPDYRAARVGDQMAFHALADEAKRIANLRRLPLVLRVTFGSSREIAKVRAFERAGLTFAGGSFVHYDPPEVENVVPMRAQAPPDRAAS